MVAILDIYRCQGTLEITTSNLTDYPGLSRNAASSNVILEQLQALDQPLFELRDVNITTVKYGDLEIESLTDDEVSKFLSPALRATRDSFCRSQALSHRAR